MALPQIVLPCALIVALATAATASATGLHAGEQKAISAEITFLDPYGQTTADSSGTTYRVPRWNWELRDPSLIYAPQCRGTYPLYFIGSPMRFTVTLTNAAARGNKPLNVRVRARSNALETSCAPGLPLGEQEFEVPGLRPGESRILTYSVDLSNPAIPSGLDITKVEVSHANQADNPDAALIAERSALWCPPALIPREP